MILCGCTGGISNPSRDCPQGAYANWRLLVLILRGCAGEISNPSGDCPRGAYANRRLLVLNFDDSVWVRC